MVRKLIFADDTAFVAHNNQNIQEIITRFSKFAQVFGLNQSPTGFYEIGEDIQIEGQVLTRVNKFKYLGSTVTNKNKLDAELDTRMSNTSTAFGRLNKPV